MLKDKGSRTRSPLIGGEVTLHGQHIFGKVGSEIFLQAYGSHIYYLTLNDNPRSVYTEAILHPITAKQYQLLPNLRRLRLTGFHNLRLSVNPVLLPCAPQLETLEIDKSLLTSLGHPHPMLTELLSNYHSQLKRLHVRLENWKIVSNLGWPSLIELQVLGIQEWAGCDSLVNCGLPNLRLIGFLEIGLSIKLGMLLELIWDMAEGSLFLNTVRFTGMIPEGQGSVAYAPPTIKRLELVDCQNLSSTGYKFLLHFPLLENLSLFWKTSKKKFAGEGGGERDDIVDVNRHICKGTMYKSNVWEMLPRLKIFGVQKKVYTRQDYERSANVANKGI